MISERHLEIQFADPKDRLEDQRNRLADEGERLAKENTAQTLTLSNKQGQKTEFVAAEFLQQAVQEINMFRS